MRSVLIICCWFFSGIVAGQVPGPGAWCKLSGPEKCWTFIHPFIAASVFKWSVESDREAHRFVELNFPFCDFSGGDADAYRHAYVMARLAARWPEKKIRSLGMAHEKGNYRFYKKHRMEDGVLPDSLGSVMDLHNNHVGIEIGSNRRHEKKEILEEKILEALKNGRLLKFSKSGQIFLDCIGLPVIGRDTLQEWSRPGCLVPTGQ